MSTPIVSCIIIISKRKQLYCHCLQKVKQTSTGVINKLAIARVQNGSKFLTNNLTGYKASISEILLLPFFPGEDLYWVHSFLLVQYHLIIWETNETIIPGFLKIFNPSVKNLRKR